MAREIRDTDVRRAAGETEGGSRARTPAGTFRSLLACFNFVVFAAAATAGILVYFPHDRAPAAGGVEGVNVEKVLKDALDENIAEVTLDEDAVNDYLAETLLPNDTGIVGALVRHGRVWLRFRDGRATLCLERSVLGHRSSIEVHIEVNARDRGHSLILTGGRFGQVPVPAGLVHMVVPVLEALRTTYQKEIEYLVAAKLITFAEGKMIVSY